MKYNISGIQNKIQKNLTNAKAQLEKARTKALTISVPGEFSYFSYLCEVPGDIKSIAASIDSTNNRIN